MEKPLASYICTLYGVFNHRWPPSRKHRLQYKKTTAFTDPLQYLPKLRGLESSPFPFPRVEKCPKPCLLSLSNARPAQLVANPLLRRILSSGSTVFTEQCSQVLGPSFNRPQTTDRGAGIKNCVVYYRQSHQKEGLTGSSRLVLWGGGSRKRVPCWKMMMRRGVRGGFAKGRGR